MSRPAKSAFESFNEIATIRIELVDSDPLVWREVKVPTSITLKGLHDVIQAVMGWFDCHLWEFTIGERRYGLLPAQLSFSVSPPRSACGGSRQPTRECPRRGSGRYDRVWKNGGPHHARAMPRRPWYCAR
jgi:Plasmid pRiA4b ORF-3-like protein